MLPDRGLRLQVHHWVGSGDGLCGSFHRSMETITVTPADIIYHCRLAVLEHAARCRNVSEACRTFGVSRTRYYEWKKLADRYGTEALMPKTRRRAQLPNATPTHVIEQLLTLAVLEPTLGARRLADRLVDAGWPLAASTAQRYLHQAGLGTRRQRVARAALITAAAGGLVTEATRDAAPMGFCHVSAGPAEPVSLDSFYIGNLKGVGRVYQLTAVDVFTRWAVVAIIVDTPTGAVTARFVDQLVRYWRRHGHQLRAVISDNGPEYIATDFRAALAAKDIRHVRIPARPPNHNAVVERFHGTILQECWRPAFHRRRFISPRQLQAAADAWLIPYNHRRRNHSDLHARPDSPSNPHQSPHPTGIMTNSHRAHLSPRNPGLEALVGRLRTRRRKLAASCRHATRHSDGRVSGVEFLAGPLAGPTGDAATAAPTPPDLASLYCRESCPSSFTGAISAQLKRGARQ